jgi:predicted phage terminase large subunit-like protein
LSRSSDSWSWNEVGNCLSDEEISDLVADWPPWARNDQAPDDLWTRRWQHWLILGGRGAGKTRAGAEWVRAKVSGADWSGSPAGRIALIGGTLDEARAVMVEGVSGLLAIHDDELRPDYEPSKRLLTWPNGAVAQIFSGEDPDSLRGPQFDAAWCDELAKWRYPQESWDMLQFGLRLGSPPQVVITTTPRPLGLLKRLISDPHPIVTRAATWRNEVNLASEFITEMQRRYRGTRLGRQELEAEIIADDPDALFRRDWIEAKRISEAPEMKRIVVALDPPAGRGGESACGIIAAGLGRDDRAYILDDATVRGKTPAQWAARAIAIYHARKADRIVAEVNQGGAMVEAVLREVDGTVAYRPVTASRGKRARAEPVAALYEQGRVSHAGSFPDLEDEMCTWHEEGEGSPDRLDALVWALTELMLGRKVAEPRVWVL